MKLAYSILAALAVSACTSPASSGSNACTSTSAAGPCTGTFSCGNSGIQGFCDKATQICLVMPGSVTCETIAGASASSCPTEADAESVAGCQTPFVASCSGASSEGITVTCAQAH